MVEAVEERRGGRLSGRSAILDYGATTQTVPAPLWAALVIVTGTAAFRDAIDRPNGETGITSGPTPIRDLRNSRIVVMCSRHHHLLHRRRLSAHLEANGDLIVITDEGRRLTSSLPDAPPLPLAG